MVTGKRKEFFARNEDGINLVISKIGHKKTV
jgi:hypothetical protein